MRTRFTSLVARTPLAVCLALSALVLAGCVGDDDAPTDPMADAVTDTTTTGDTSTTDTSTADTTVDDTSTADTTVDDTSTSDTTLADTSTSDTFGEDTVEMDTTDATDTADTTMCETGTDDCDGDPSNGCESLDTVDNCGACGTACTLVNATASCDAGACVIAMCEENTDDCDGNAANGCEEDFGAAGGACCDSVTLTVELDGADVATAQQGTWAIYKSGGALAENLHCGADFNTPAVKSALDPVNRPVDLVWRRNCASDDLLGAYTSGNQYGISIVLMDGGLAAYSESGTAEIESYVYFPNGSSCLETEQITFRLL